MQSRGLLSHSAKSNREMCVVPMGKAVDFPEKHMLYFIVAFVVE